MESKFLTYFQMKSIQPSSLNTLVVSLLTFPTLSVFSLEEWQPEKQDYIPG